MDRTWMYKAWRMEAYFLAELNNAFKLRRTMQEMRRQS